MQIISTRFYQVVKEREFMDYILDGHREGEEYKLEHLIRDLNMGREIDFTYKGQEYSISHSKEGWHLSKHGGESQTFISCEKLIKEGLIAGFTLKDVWNDVEVSCIF
jgi:hypothetical protein